MKIYSLQLLRAIAAWMIVYHHLMQTFFDFKSDSILGWFFSNKGSFGVDVFFVLSGVVMYQCIQNRNYNARQFFVKRIMRIVPVYWFYTLLISLLIYILPTIFDYTSFDIISLIKSLLFIPFDNPSGIGVYPILTVGWTLNYEFFFYMLIALVLSMSNRRVALKVSICMTLMPILSFFLPSHPIWMWVIKSPLLYQFIVGLCIADMYKRYGCYINEVSRSLRLVICIVLLTGSGLSLFMPEISGVSNPYIILSTNTASASLLVGMFMIMEGLLSFSGKIPSRLLKLGDISYSTYLCHSIIESLVLYGFIVFDINIEDYLLTAVLITTLLVYWSSVLSYRYIERVSISIGKMMVH
ncbi:acyltransferase [Halosquirtibacter xylanolyticus]|uniref:acyltransferase family protein n=1 Tax=Halosquirtibacter xylanolyticus TaxID=3374599 RepID=UPI003748A454|nr:acyltransferase [Prolixibacteraceae bacterium]